MLASNCTRGRCVPFSSGPGAAQQRRGPTVRAGPQHPAVQRAAPSPRWRQAATQRRVHVRAAAATAVSLPELPVLDDGYERRCTFSDFANWLLPEHVMLGRYPYVEPSRCKSVERGEGQLRAILEAGITTFVCLQDELPEQSAMRIGGVDGFLPYRATATLLASALSDPPSLEECGALRTPELDKFLPPRRRRGPAPAEQRRRIELDFVHSPIVDLGVPAPDRLESLLEDLAARLHRGERLYIHCWGGRGRAGTVGACLLARLYGVGAEEALARVDRAFSTRGDVEYRSPETPEQQQFVREFIGRP